MWYMFGVQDNISCLSMIAHIKSACQEAVEEKMGRGVEKCTQRSLFLVSVSRL